MLQQLLYIDMHEKRDPLRVKDNYGRRTHTVTNSDYDSWKETVFGVPQVSILRPSL